MRLKCTRQQRDTPATPDRTSATAAFLHVCASPQSTRTNFCQEGVTDKVAGSVSVRSALRRLLFTQAYDEVDGTSAHFLLGSAHSRCTRAFPRPRLSHVVCFGGRRFYGTSADFMITMERTSPRPVTGSA
jgi:hypothetical protein